MSSRYFGVTVAVATEPPWMPADKGPLKRFRKALEKRFGNWTSRIVNRGEFDDFLVGHAACDAEIFQIWRLSKRQNDAVRLLINRYLPPGSHCSFTSIWSAGDPMFVEEVHNASA
jgi:hypothetical protein